MKNSGFSRVAFNDGTSISLFLNTAFVYVNVAGLHLLFMKNHRCFPGYHLILLFPVWIVVFSLISCANNDPVKTNYPDSHINSTPNGVACDTNTVDQPPVKDYRQSLAVWLETTPLDWFLRYRQSAWREAKAWNSKPVSVDSNSIIKCLCAGKKNIFLYIPNHFYTRLKNGTEYIDFLIVNNTSDTIAIPCIDDVINHISSSVSAGLSNSTAQQWLSFQETAKIAECGNSYWVMKLPPKTAIASQLEAGYLNLGDTAVNYRLELTVDRQKIVSNSIRINLMKQQLPYLGKPVD
jgi:hypothetical protein